jgi:hypothetical protein
MGKGGRTGTIHHCPGRKVWIGDISPGNCVKACLGKMTYCGKHMTPCINGCADSNHLKNQLGCTHCMGKMEAEARRERERQQADKVRSQAEEDSSFWNPPKGRKR